MWRHTVRVLFSAVLLTSSAHAFDVKGIEPGKTTAKEARRIVESTAKPDSAPGPWGEGRCYRAYEDLPAGSPLQGYRKCAWVFRRDNVRGEASTPWLGGPFQLAGVRGHPGWDLDSKGVLQSFDLVFHSDDFEKLKAAAIAKWGNPTKREKGRVQNRMGATFDNEVLMWKSEKGVVLLYERDKKLELGYLLIQSKQFIADDDKDTALRKTEKRKDF